MANGPSTSYPVMGGPSLQSVMARQRMGIEDAMYAAERQRERKSDVLEKGAKGVYEYDKMLRGFMEAKYANPDLKFWDYVSKPSVGAAYRKQGRDIIAEKALAGDKIKGMGFGARHKAGLRGLFGKDVNELTKLEKGAGVRAGMESGDTGTQGLDMRQIKAQESLREELGLSDLALEKAEELAMLKAMPEQAVTELPEMEAYLKASGDLGEQYEKISAITSKIKKGSAGRRAYEKASSEYVIPGEKLEDVLGGGKVPVPGDPGYSYKPLKEGKEALEHHRRTFEQYKKFFDIKRGVKEGPKGIDAREAYVMPGENLKTLLEKGKGGRVPIPGDPGRELPSMVGKGVNVPELGNIPVKGGRLDAISLATHTQADIDKRMAEATKAILARKAGGDVAVKGVGDVAVKAAGEQAAKGGLKSALGKAGSALALGGGLYTAAKGETAMERTGGAVSAAGGAAGLIAATNFWNPVGWAAAIPAALSLAGGGMAAAGARKSGSLAGTPLGRYRRRIGII